MTGNTDTTPTPTRRRVKRWFPLLILLLAAAVAGIVTVWPGQHEPDRPGGIAASVPQRPAADLAAARDRARLRPCPPAEPSGQPPAALQGLRVSCLGDGTSVDLGAALAGRTALINVWASWCSPCREELPVLDAYATTSGAVQVLGVQVQSDPADGLGLLTSLNVHFPSVVDTDGTLSRALHAPAYLPVSYVVTPDGTIHQVLPPTPFTSVGQVHERVQAIMSRPN